MADLNTKWYPSITVTDGLNIKLPATHVAINVAPIAKFIGRETAPTIAPTLTKPPDSAKSEWASFSWK